MTGTIQVVICRCCVENPALIDLARLEAVAAETELVSSVVISGAVCDGKGVADIAKDAQEREADRAVVVACDKKDFDPALLKAYRRAGIDESMVEFLNLREGVALPHARQTERAQAKAETMLRAALKRAMMLKHLERETEEMRTRNVVIVGAGVAGRAAAETAARAGMHTILIEKGNRSFKAPGVLMTSAKVVGGKGYPGNYVLTIEAGEKVEELECAALVVATGGGWTTLKGPLAKACKEAVPLYRLNEQVEAGTSPKGPVVIVDTPDPSGKNLKVMDFAWEEALQTAMSIKRTHAQTDVTMVFQEMRAFGLSELAYREAADMGIRFVRYDKSGAPKIDSKDPTRLTVKDLAQGELLTLRFSTLAFASLPANPDNKDIADALRIPMTPEGAMRRGSIQRWPVSTPRPGIYVCGSALFPKAAEVAKAEGEAAGAMAARFAKSGNISFGGVVAEVTQEKCSACLTCMRTCPFEAPFIGRASKVEIRKQLCQGCGMCAGVCPSKAIDLLHFTDDQLREQTRVLLGGDF